MSLSPISSVPCCRHDRMKENFIRFLYLTCGQYLAIPTHRNPKLYVICVFDHLIHDSSIESKVMRCLNNPCASEI